MRYARSARSHAGVLRAMYSLPSLHICECRSVRCFRRADPWRRRPEIGSSQIVTGAACKPKVAHAIRPTPASRDEVLDCRLDHRGSAPIAEIPVPSQQLLTGTPSRLHGAPIVAPRRMLHRTCASRRFSHELSPPRARGTRCSVEMSPLAIGRRHQWQRLPCRFSRAFRSTAVFVLPGRRTFSGAQVRRSMARMGTIRRKPGRSRTGESGTGRRGTGSRIMPAPISPADSGAGMGMDASWSRRPAPASGRRIPGDWGRAACRNQGLLSGGVSWEFGIIASSIGSA